jgi:hypothetical protein
MPGLLCDAVLAKRHYQIGAGLCRLLPFEALPGERTAREQFDVRLHFISELAVCSSQAEEPA